MTVGCGNTVFGPESLVGCADEAALTNPAQPHRARIRLDKAVVEPARAAPFFIAFTVIIVMLIQLGRAGNAIVPGIAPGAVDMPGPAAAATVQAQYASALVGNTAATPLEAPFQGRGRHAFGDAVVNHVDHPANRTRTIQQRCRTAQDLDAVDQHGLDADGVIVGLGRRINGRYRVFEHLHTRPTQTPDDRPSGTLTVERRMHARLTTQRFAYGCSAPVVKPLASEHIDRLCRIKLAALERQCTDGDGLQVGTFGVPGTAVLLFVFMRVLTRFGIAILGQRLMTGQREGDGGKQRTLAHCTLSRSVMV